MNAVSCSLEHFPGPDFEKQARQGCALVNVGKATSTVNKVHLFVVEAASVAVYCDILVSACHADESVYDLRLDVFAILLARWKCVVAPPRRSLPIRSRIFAVVVVCY